MRNLVSDSTGKISEFAFCLMVYFDNAIQLQNSTLLIVRTQSRMQGHLLKRAKKRNLIDFNVEELMDELDVSDVEFKKTIKEDYEASLSK